MDWNSVSGQISVQASSFRSVGITTESNCLEHLGRRSLKDLYRASFGDLDRNRAVFLAAGGALSDLLEA